MPYRIDLTSPPGDVLDRLVRLGALDVDVTPHGVAAILPDAVLPGSLAQTLGTAAPIVTPAHGRDSDSVWLLSPRPVRVGRFLIAPAADAPAGAVRLTDSAAFGTGCHPTTALCLEALEDELDRESLPSMLDVGTGSGVLAIAALCAGVPEAVGVETDRAAIDVAATHASINGVTGRLRLVHGTVEAIDGRWPFVVANVLPGPLIAMAPHLVRRVGRAGRLVLSGIPDSVAADVIREYVRLGMRLVRVGSRGGWAAPVLDASW